MFLAMLFLAQGPALWEEPPPQDRLEKLAAFETCVRATIEATWDQLETAEALADAASTICGREWEAFDRQARIEIPDAVAEQSFIDMMGGAVRKDAAAMVVLHRSNLKKE